MYIEAVLLAVIIIPETYSIVHKNQMLPHQSNSEIHMLSTIQLFF
jgi:hypothetical protein